VAIADNSVQDSMLNQSDHATQSGSPLSAMRLPAHRDLHNVTDSSWVSTVTFQCKVFVVYSTDGASGRHYVFTNSPFHSVLGLLDRFVA
jgi:hypothetical protein